MTPLFVASQGVPLAVIASMLAALLSTMFHPMSGHALPGSVARHTETGHALPGIVRRTDTGHALPGAVARPLTGHALPG